ncbi:hypothetical protein [Planctomicrobium sp. SH664]|uniref:hypothetical protein n=1 Tax=Planctomicrobium sp. SH664 TaxID=3448125 RepID=UPI003F5CA230
MASPGPPAVPRRRTAVDASQSVGKPQLPPRLPSKGAVLWQRLKQHLSSPEGMSWGSSLLVHLILLGVLAIPVYSTLSKRESVTSILGGDEFREVHFDGPVSTDLIVPPAEVPQEDRPNTMFDALVSQSVPELDLFSNSIVGGTGGAGGEGEGDGAGNGDGVGGLGVGGIRIAEPKNAVRAGNFSVWAWPIISKDLKGKIIHAQPGSAPQVHQDYHIVIRIRVPRERRSVNLSDFSGDVTGTDRYFQKIPEDAYFFNTRGELVAARTGRPIPVIDGTAELLIRVPGAAVPSVRDTIKVRSEILKEEQKIELVFASRES